MWPPGFQEDMGERRGGGGQKMATVEEQAGEESGQAQEGDTNGSPLEASVLSTVQTIQDPLISGLEPETHFTSSFLSPCSLSSKLNQFCGREACQGTISGIQGKNEMKVSIWNR